jgi:hypothetical protein
MSISRMVFIKILGITYVPLLALMILIMGVVMPMVFYNIMLRLQCWWLFSLKKPVDELNYINQKL